MNDLTEAPEPGLYPDVPMSEYHSWDALSNSQLSRLEQSPRHLKTYLEEKQEETRAMKLGRMIHSSVLEPDVFQERYVVLGQCEGEKADGDRCSNNAKVIRPEGQYCGIHDPGGDDLDVECVKDDDYKIAEGIRNSIENSDSCMSMLSGSGKVELSIVWEDSLTGVTCKARMDRYSPEIPGGAIVDLKTTNDASPRNFSRKIFNFGYHRQAIFYLRGAKELGYDISNFVILAAEKSPPYAVQPYRFQTDELQTDDIRQQVNELLKLYSECRKQEKWPAYPDKVQDISIPGWAWNQIETQNERINHIKEAV